jgi:hypothetical protein
MDMSRLPDDPLDALYVVAAQGRQRPELESHIVRVARQEGYSWNGISAALGQPRDAVFAAYSTEPGDSPLG